VKLPRDLTGEQLAGRLAAFGYTVVRQTGSHMRLVSTHMKHEHKITIPNHAPLKVGTLAALLADVAEYLKKSKSDLADELFR